MDMGKRYIKKETLTLSRQQEIVLVDDDIGDKKTHLALFKAIYSKAYFYLLKSISIKRGDKDGDSNQ